MLSIHVKNHLCRECIPLFISPVRAGFPSPAAVYTVDGLDFNELLVRHKAATYCLKVSGDSMSGIGIFPGDMLVVDRSLTPVDGDIVVASVQGEFTVKRLVLRHRNIMLKPENPSYQPIHIGEGDQLEIFGVVTSVVRQYSRTRRS
jgi:DNA polymerase V